MPSPWLPGMSSPHSEDPPCIIARFSHDSRRFNLLGAPGVLGGPHLMPVGGVYGSALLSIAPRSSSSGFSAAAVFSWTSALVGVLLAAFILCGDIDARSLPASEVGDGCLTAASAAVLACAVIHACGNVGASGLSVRSRLG